MMWLSGIPIVTVLISIQTVLSQRKNELDRGPYQCHCSCSSPYNPDSIVMTTAKLRRQGHMLTMDSVSTQDSNNYIKNLLGSVYEKLARTLSDMDRNQFDKLRQSLQVQNGGKMPKDMAVTVVDLFKKALYADDNNIGNNKHVNVPYIPKSILTNSNGFVTDKMQVVIEKQKTDLKRWQKTEENIKQAHKEQQVNQNMSKAKVPAETQTATTQTEPKAYTLRTLNTLIKTATERLVELYGKAQVKKQQSSPSLGPPPIQQAFRNERMTVDEAVRGKPFSSYKSDNHGFWTQETGSVVDRPFTSVNSDNHGVWTQDTGRVVDRPFTSDKSDNHGVLTQETGSVVNRPFSSVKSNNQGFRTQETGSVVDSKSMVLNEKPTSNSDIGPRTNVPQEITRTPLTNIITGRPNLNEIINSVHGIPLSNAKIGQNDRNTDSKETNNLSFSNTYDNNRQTMVNKNSDKITRLPLSNNNIHNGQPISNTNGDMSNRQPLSNDHNVKNIINANSNEINPLPFSNNDNNGQDPGNTNNDKSSRLPLSNINNEHNIANGNIAKMNDLPLSTGNTRQAGTGRNSKNTPTTQPLVTNEKKNVSLAPYEVPPSNPTKPTVYVTVEPNPSSIAYYKPNTMSSETVKSDPVGTFNNLAGNNIDVKSMLDLSVSKKISNIGPPSISEQANALTKKMPTGGSTAVKTVLDDALFQKISNASPETRSLFTDAMLQELPNHLKNTRNTKSTNTLVKNNDVSAPKQGKKSIQMSPQTGGGNTQVIADTKQQQHIHVNLDSTTQPSTGMDVFDGMFGNHIGKTNPVNVNPIGLPLPEQTIQNPINLPLPEQTIQNPLGNEWDVLLKQTPQPYVPPSNLQPQNFRNSAQDIMTVSDLYKLLANLSNNQQLDAQYAHRSTTAANNADLAMAMMFGAWRK